MDVTQQYFDIDYINFVKGEVSDNPGGGDEPPISINSKVRLESPVLAAYDVFDANGVRLGRMRAYSMSEAVQILKSTSDIKNNGVYMLRSVQNGAVKSVRISR